MVAAAMHYYLHAYGISDKGLLRSHLEDLWSSVPEKGFYVLADGMGGHQAGEVASRIAVEVVCEKIKQKWKAKGKTPHEGSAFIKKVVEYANYCVYSQSISQQNLHGMGTTLCCLLFHPEAAIYAHVGDSRIYRYSNMQLEQLTQDHSLNQERASQGLPISLSVKHVLTRAIGTASHVEPSIAVADVAIGDIFLMCSDGLSDLVTNEELQELIENVPIKKLASVLVSLAKDRGGHDNITVIVIQVHEKNLS